MDMIKDERGRKREGIKHYIKFHMGYEALSEVHGHLR